MLYAHTIRKVKFSQVFHPKFFFTIFLVKSKLSTAKKSKTTTFSRVFHPQKSAIFSGNQSWIFDQKMKISNSVIPLGNIQANFGGIKVGKSVSTCSCFSVPLLPAFCRKKRGLLPDIIRVEFDPLKFIIVDPFFWYQQAECFSLEKEEHTLARRIFRENLSSRILFSTAKWTLLSTQAWNALCACVSHALWHAPTLWKIQCVSY